MTSPAETTDSAGLIKNRRWVFVLFTLLLAAALWVMTRGWHDSLLDRFQFRQTQTAVTAYWIQQDGFRLDYPMPVFGPPWSAPMEFPLYQWLVAITSTVLGISLESAARTLGILFFLGSLPAVYGLAGLVETNPQRRLLIPAAVLAAPVGLFYSRGFMIESCATFFAVWFLHAYTKSLRESPWSLTALALIAGTLAALVKITTFVLVGIPAILFTLCEAWKIIAESNGPDRRHAFRNLAFIALVPAIPILVIATWWVHFSDAVKGANPFAAMLTSLNLRGWNFGTVSQRLSLEFWTSVGHQWSVGAVSVWLTLPLLLVLPVVAPRYRHAALACAAGFFVGPLVFANLFANHGYYYFPAAFFAAAAAGFAVAGVCALPKCPFFAKVTSIAAFVVIQAINFDLDYAITLKHPPAPPPPIANVVESATPQDHIVLIYGWDWNTLIPYYAKRRAIMVPSFYENDTSALLNVLGRLPTGQVSTLVLKGEKRNTPEFIRWCTSLLGLASTPLFESPEGAVYVSVADAQRLKSVLEKDPARQSSLPLNFSLSDHPVDPRLHYQKPDPAAYQNVTSPVPFAVYNPWEIQVADIAGAPGISANAPSEIHFHAPPGARHIEATVGIVEGAYQGAQKTDGIDVLIFELLPGGSGRRILYQRYLNPSANPADRGLQSIAIDSPVPISGPLVFGLYPGPADNMSFDWGFWRKIKIE